MPTKSVERGMCSECGVKRNFYQTQIRRLREKLEFSELRVHELALQCVQLREELKLAKWQARSSLVAHRESPRLPNELLREIFALATAVNDLAFSPWNVETRGHSWNISLLTRQSIPLVCLQWHLVGTEFLYEHIVLSQPSQVIQLVDFLDSLQGDRRLNYLSWIHGLELTLGPVSKKGAVQYWREASNLAGLLPPNRLKVFGMDCLDYMDAAARMSAESTAKFAFLYFKNSVEVLHLPFVGHHLEWDFFAQVDIMARETDSLSPPYFPRLHTLSTTIGRWDVWMTGRHQEHPLRVLRGHTPTLRSLSFDWSPENDGIVSFLCANPQLERICVGDGVRSHFLAHHLDLFLQSVPRLKHLTINTSDRTLLASVTNPNHVSHSALEEIVILMNYAVSYKMINSLSAIFEKVKNGKLPGLRRIILYGPFFEGCLDGALIFPAQHLSLWKGAIEACASQGVEFVNTQEDPIHLWNTRHAISSEVQHSTNMSEESFQSDAQEISEVSSNQEVTSDEESTTEESQWYEEEMSDYNPRTSDEDIISNDSEDTPYRYVSQPDLAYIDSSSDSDASSE